MRFLARDGNGFGARDGEMHSWPMVTLPDLGRKGACLLLCCVLAFLAVLLAIRKSYSAFGPPKFCLLLVLPVIALIPSNLSVYCPSDV